jgi:hypothetical protein
MRRVWWSVLLVLAVGLGAAACGGGGNGGEGETPTAVTTAVATAQSLPHQAPTPFPTPLITNNHLESPTKGYAADFPEGWTVTSNVLTYPGVTADAFFGPTEIAGVKPNISVSREDLGGEESPQTYVQDKVKAAQGLGAQGLTIQGGKTVAGQEASVISYGLTRDTIQLDKEDAVFVGGGFGWIITLIAPAGQRATFQPLFDQLLASFKLLTPSGG